MSAYRLLLQTSGRDWGAMHARLSRMLRYDEEDILLCIDFDGHEIGWTFVYVEDNYENGGGRVCGMARVSMRSDISRALNSMLNQCLQRLVDLELY